VKKTETLGQRLQRLRQAANFTQTQLAAHTDLAVSNIRNWEQDHRTPNLFALLKLARALGRRMEDFVEGVVESRGQEARER
jgi:transcriptional regulator with XRE-family HTH domain